MIQLSITEAEAIELAKLLAQSGCLPEVKDRLNAELNAIQQFWQQVTTEPVQEAQQ